MAHHLLYTLLLLIQLFNFANLTGYAKKIGKGESSSHKEKKFLIFAREQFALNKEKQAEEALQEEEPKKPLIQPKPNHLLESEIIDNPKHLHTQEYEREQEHKASAQHIKPTQKPQKIEPDTYIYQVFTEKFDTKEEAVGALANIHYETKQDLKQTKQAISLLDSSIDQLTRKRDGYIQRKDILENELEEIDDFAEQVSKAWDEKEK